MLGGLGVIVPALFWTTSGRAALPAVMLAVAVVLATGCSSTGAGFNARLISPMPNNQQATNSEDAGINHRGVLDLILSA
jgi:hypothetical protein